jgi:two-component system copper resistance phosphate regulon response regulator CusR
MRVLMAEDDRQLGKTLAKGLREHSYAVDIVGDGAGALYQAAVVAYDVIILDVMMPVKNGLQVCRELRERGNRAPVLMLTARDTVADKIAGLDAGGDDYLSKPFAFEELLARMRALLRRGPELLPSEIVVDDLVIDTQAQTARRGRRLIRLTTKEYTLLEFLARNANRVVGREAICSHVWDDNHDPFSNAIEVHINRLRRKVDEAGRAPLIHTRRGAGYMLMRLPDDGCESTTSSTAPLGPSGVSQRPDPKRDRT